MASAAAPAFAGEAELIGVVERRIARVENGSAEGSKTVLLYGRRLEFPLVITLGDSTAFINGCQWLPAPPAKPLPDALPPGELGPMSAKMKQRYLRFPLVRRRVAAGIPFDQAVRGHFEAVESTLRRASRTYRDHLKDGWSKAHAAACGSIESSFADNDPSSATAPMISENGSMVFFWGMGWRGTDVSHPRPVRKQRFREDVGEWFRTLEGAMSSEGTVLVISCRSAFLILAGEDFASALSEIEQVEREARRPGAAERLPTRKSQAGLSPEIFLEIAEHIGAPGNASR